MKINTRLYLLSLISVILMAMVGVITFYAVAQMKRQVAAEMQIGNMTIGLSELNLISHEYLRYHEERMKEQWGLKYGSLGQIMKGLEEECLDPQLHHGIHESMGRDFKQIGSLFSEIQTVFTNRKRLMEENSPRTRIGDVLIKENMIADQLMMTSRLMMSEALRLGAMLHEEIRGTQERTKALLLFSIIGFVLLWFCISFFTVGAITKAVNKLARGVEIIGKGDLEHRVEIKTRDEIGQLAAAFNQMVEKRQRAEVALVKAHDELEIRVQERTAELAGSNASLKHEIADRKRAEERINHLNLVLRALRNINKLIVTEKDHYRLIKSACDNFIITRGYHNAWIALFDESGNFTAGANAGLGETFSRVLEMLERGDFTRCCREALGQSGVLVIANPVEACKDCPQAKGYADREAMAIRLEHKDKVYGILSVSVPEGVVTDREELALFNEVAGDIAFALYNIETEGRRRATEELLRESEEKYRVLVENANDSILVVQDDILKFHNSMTEEKTGLSSEELANTPFINLVHPEDRDMVDDRYKRRLKGEKLPASHSFRVVNKAGEGLWVHLSSTVVSWDGRPATLNFIRDITQQKKLEDELRQAQKMEAIGILAGGVAHDFNNLLTAILGNAEFELMNLGKDNPLCESLKEIIKAGNSATSLTRQLLAFSRKQVLHPVVMNLNTVTVDIDKMLRRIIGEDIELKTLLEPDLGNVMSDPGQIEHVLMNLAVNARDAMPLGGKLTVETANVDLEEDYFVKHGVIAVPGPYVMLAVTDTGSGMDKETQLRIFEPFFTTKDTGEGTGLGLSTVYGIIKQSGGDIRAYSEPGQGTVFKIYLPRVGEDVEAVQAGDAMVEQLGGSETILLVEDNNLVRKVSRRCLEQYGYRVLEAEDAHKALMMSEQHEGLIELMVTDVVMPEMSGKELAERLQPLRPEMKVLYMSGYTDNEVVRRGVIGRGVAFLEKPFTPDVLAGKVRQVLDKKQD